MSVSSEQFRVQGQTATPAFDVGDQDLVLCRRVLDGVGAAHGIEFEGGDARIWAVVRHAVVP
jgi:hypothetical protein